MSEAKEAAKKEIENEMVRRMRELLGQGEDNDIDGIVVVEEYEDPTPPLEAALERALYSLKEISIYGSYGRSSECMREADATLEALNKYKAKWLEQNPQLAIPEIPEDEENA